LSHKGLFDRGLETVTDPSPPPGAEGRAALLFLFHASSPSAAIFSGKILEEYPMKSWQIILAMLVTYAIGYGHGVGRALF
jgi:hypothetical protein